MAWGFVNPLCAIEIDTANVALGFIDELSMIGPELIAQPLAGKAVVGLPERTFRPHSRCNHCFDSTLRDTAC